MFRMIDFCVYDEAYINEEDETITFYFVGDTYLLHILMGEQTYDVPDDCDIFGVSISVECPSMDVNARHSSISYSPILKYADGTSDFDWTDDSFARYQLSYAQIEELLNIAMYERETKPKLRYLLE